MNYPSPTYTQSDLTDFLSTDNILVPRNLLLHYYKMHR